MGGKKYHKYLRQAQEIPQIICFAKKLQLCDAINTANIAQKLTISLTHKYSETNRQILDRKSDEHFSLKLL